VGFILNAVIYQEEIRKTINLPVITGQQRKKNEK
jgi:hypothetical protein